ncbi:hypothetical protein KY335_01400 [Candidatus Woesearchaeota archaeon]|nr:hypothetical protein [Candidatus Woesearchaeota archaeon]
MAYPKGRIEEVKHDRRRKMTYGILTNVKTGGQIPYVAKMDMRLKIGQFVKYKVPAKKVTPNVPISWGKNPVEVVEAE